jgi:hypothetical protein
MDSSGTNFQSLINLSPALPYLLASNIVDEAQQNGPYYSIANFISRNSDLLSSAVPAEQTTDWRREGPLRSVVNALTVRGEQFSIFGLGQSLSMNRGVLEVTGESYVQTVVDRVKTNGIVYYRPLYYRVVRE